MPIANEEKSSLEHLINLLLLLLSIRDVAKTGTAVSGSWSGGSQDGDAGLGDAGKELASGFGGAS